MYNDEGVNPAKNITFINIYVPRIEVPKYKKRTLTDLKREIENNTLIVGNFNTHISLMDRSFRQNNQ